MSVYIHVASKLRPSQLAVTVLDCLADSRGRHLVGDLDVALRREIGEQLWNDRQVAHLMAAQAEAASDVLERGAAEMAWLSSMPIMDCSSRHSGCRSGSWSAPEAERTSPRVHLTLCANNGPEQLQQRSPLTTGPILMAFEIVSDRGAFAGIVLPSPTTTRSLITSLPSGRHHDKTGAWEMHTDLSDRGIVASDDDLMDARADRLADDRVASGIIRRDGYCLTRFPADRISRIGDCAGDRRRVPRRIERLFRGCWAPPAVADGGNALGPAQQPRKAVERRRR